MRKYLRQYGSIPEHDTLFVIHNEQSQRVLCSSLRRINGSTSLLRGRGSSPDRDDTVIKEGLVTLGTPVELGVLIINQDKAFDPRKVRQSGYPKTSTVYVNTTYRYSPLSSSRNSPQTPACIMNWFDVTVFYHGNNTYSVSLGTSLTFCSPL